MTIFLEVLKELILAQLDIISKRANSKMNSGYSNASRSFFGAKWAYNKDLSLETKVLIDHLVQEINAYQIQSEEPKTDLEACQEIVKIIDNTLTRVQAVRKNAGELIDGGKSVPCLKNLKEYAVRFYTNLSAFNKPDQDEELEEPDDNAWEPLKLTDKIYRKTPEGMIYYQAARYIGDEVFNPSPYLDDDIRKAKEKALATRLQILSALIKPGMNLTARKATCMQALNDISTDNATIISGGKKKTDIPIGLSMGPIPLSLSAPKKLMSPGEGRLEELLKVAGTKIRLVPDEDFLKAIEASSHYEGERKSASL